MNEAAEVGTEGEPPPARGTWRYRLASAALLAGVGASPFVVRGAVPLAVFVLAPSYALYAAFRFVGFGVEWLAPEWMASWSGSATATVIVPAAIGVASVLLSVELWARLLRGLLDRSVPLARARVPAVVILSLGLGASWLGSGHRGERSRNSPCDNVYVALNGEVAAELHGESGCRSSEPSAVARCVLSRHRSEPNPLDPALPAYTSGEVVPCQVRLRPAESSVRFIQRVSPEARRARSFSVSLD